MASDVVRHFDMMKPPLKAQRDPHLKRSRGVVKKNAGAQRMKNASSLNTEALPLRTLPDPTL